MATEEPPSGDEQVICAASRRVLDLVDRLIDRPIDATTYRDLQDYLHDQAPEAVAAHRRLSRLPVAQLEAHIGRGFSL